jgi:hypothetical protein
MLIPTATPSADSSPEWMAAFGPPPGLLASAPDARGAYTEKPTCRSCE